MEEKKEKKNPKKIKSGEIGIMSSVFFYKNPFFCGYLDLLSLADIQGMHLLFINLESKV